MKSKKIIERVEKVAFSVNEDNSFICKVNGRNILLAQFTEEAARSLARVLTRTALELWGGIDTKYFANFYYKSFYKNDKKD